MKKKYYVGHYIKDQDLFAEVYIVAGNEEAMSKKYETVAIMITFDQAFTYNELKNKGILLPFYTRSKKTKWIFKVNERKIILPELNRLSKLGFKILDPQTNPHLHKLIASWI